MYMPFGLAMLPPRIHRPSNKTPSTRHENHLFKLLIRELKWFPEQYRLLLLPLVASQRLKPLLLKMPCTSNTVLRGIKLSNLNISSLSTNFHSTRRHMQIANRGKQSTVLPSCNAYKWQDTPKVQ